jgi:succinate dehydrogenase hydrophobic anchor subunit
MTTPGPVEGKRLFADLHAPGRSSFDWAILFAALALVFPVSGVLGVVFADRSRRKGYRRWKSAMAIAIWCAFLGIVLRGLVHMGVFP